MTWVTCSIRSQSLLNRKYQMNMELMNISQKLQDLQTYGSNIADGVISQAEAGNCPSSLFGTQMQFMGNSTAVAYQSAQAKTNAYLQQLGGLNQNTGGQYQLAADGANSQIQPALIFNQIFKQELAEYTKKITEKINKEEQKLMQEQKRMEVQLQAVDAEYESVQKAMEDDIKKSAIKLA